MFVQQFKIAWRYPEINQYDKIKNKNKLCQNVKVNKK